METAGPDPAPETQTQTAREMEKNTPSKKNSVKLSNKDLTDREKAVIIWAVVTHCGDWRKIYLLSRPNDPSTYSEKSLTRIVSKWKQLLKVKIFYEEQTAFYNAVRPAQQTQPATAGTDEERAKETKPKNETDETQTAPDVDVINTQNALQELNRNFNLIKDPVKRADVIMSIQKIVQQQKSEAENGPDIQRFYTPVACRDCVLYREARQSDESGPK